MPPRKIRQFSQNPKTLKKQLFKVLEYLGNTDYLRILNEPSLILSESIRREQLELYNDTITL